MSTPAKVFMNGRSQAIRLPKEFRIREAEVRITRVPGGLFITEGDPWDTFQEECKMVSDDFFKAMESRDRMSPQIRDFKRGSK